MGYDIFPPSLGCFFSLSLPPPSLPLSLFPPSLSPPLCRIVTEVSSPSPLTSVTMLKDGSTLLAGGADGMYHILMV